MAASVMQPKGDGSATYTYTSQPRAVSKREKYRDQSEYGNIMYDKRIVRGNTYALHTLPASSQPDPLEVQRQQESQRRALARRRARNQLKPSSPDAVEGRKHIEVQTELYLEEITDRVEEADVQTQTDAFLDRPPTPLFVPAKTGQDVSTQIEDGDLFDFDLEVRPILEVLVGKTVEQALLEVMEEEELASLRTQQRYFEENRNAELVETQRLEEQERRRREEKERRMQQQREALLKEKETAEKIAARAFAQSYLSDLVPSVFGTLSESGFFYDPVEREVETVFVPWLMDQTELTLDKEMTARTLLDVIIREVVAGRLGVPVPEYVVPEPTSTTTEAQATTQETTTPPTEPSKDEDVEKPSEDGEVKQLDEAAKDEVVDPAGPKPSDSEAEEERQEGAAASDEQQGHDEEPPSTSEPPAEQPTPPPPDGDEGPSQAEQPDPPITTTETAGEEEAPPTDTVEPDEGSPPEQA